MKKNAPLRNAEKGYTFIEFMMVIIVLGIAGSMAAQKLISMGENVEIAGEDSVIGILQSNVTNNYLESILKSNASAPPAHAVNPFENLPKVPEGYTPRRTLPPSGNPVDDRMWVFVPMGGSSGLIYHQRRDHTVVAWPYDSATGKIGDKDLERKSVIKMQLELQQLQRGERSEEDILQRKDPTRGQSIQIP